MIELSIIIVNFGSSKVLGGCLMSLRTTKIKGGFEIIIYDNGPDDEGLTDLARKFPQIKIISQDRFLSFSAANNRAAKLAAGKYLLFLNPDTCVNHNTIEHLLNFIANNEKIGAIGPKLVAENGEIELSFGLDPGILAEALMIVLKSLSKKIKKHILRLYRIKKVDWISGAAILIKNENFAVVGGFDENFPLYFEDVDLCHRIRKLGWDIYYYPLSEIIHYRGSAGGINKTTQKKTDLSDSEIKYRTGQLLYYSKHKGQIQNYLLKLYLKCKFGTEYNKFANCS